jgi:hypothetical protein
MDMKSQADQQGTNPPSLIPGNSSKPTNPPTNPPTNAPTRLPGTRRTDESTDNVLAIVVEKAATVGFHSPSEDRWMSMSMRRYSTITSTGTTLAVGTDGLGGAYHACSSVKERRRTGLWQWAYDGCHGA